MRVNKVMLGSITRAHQQNKFGFANYSNDFLAQAPKNSKNTNAANAATASNAVAAASKSSATLFNKSELIVSPTVGLIDCTATFLRVLFTNFSS